MLTIYGGVEQMRISKSTTNELHRASSINGSAHSPFHGHNEAGVGKITIAIFGLLTAAVVYSAYNIFPFFYDYYELRNQMESLARVASTQTDQELRRKLFYHIKKMELPLDPEDVRISRNDGKIQMQAQYDEVFSVPFQDKYYEIHVFHFDAYIDEAY